MFSVVFPMEKSTGACCRGILHEKAPASLDLPRQLGGGAGAFDWGGICAGGADGSRTAGAGGAVWRTCLAGASGNWLESHPCGGFPAGTAWLRGGVAVTGGGVVALVGTPQTGEVAATPGQGVERGVVGCA